MTALAAPPARGALRAAVRDLVEYQPVPPPATLAAQLGIPLERIVKLDANENPYGAPPGVAAALAGLDPSRYPDADACDLRTALAAYTQQPAELIVCGNGSDELLELLCRLFLTPGDAIVTAEPTFGMYAIAARQHGARVVDVPRDPADFALDRPALLGALRREPRLLFLCAPNNPTGTPLPEGELRAILDAAPCPLVLDEAYAEFAGWSALPLLDEYPHLIVLRTLSKFAGLAGLRLGYAVAAAGIARGLRKMKAPYNVNLAAQVAGVAALGEMPWITDRLVRLRAGRAVLETGLGALPGIRLYPSAANFVLLRVPGGQPAADAVHAGLLARGIMVRRYSHDPLRGCLRVSVGTEAQNAILLEEMEMLWPSS